jgi:hypothetical protein
MSTYDYCMAFVSAMQRTNDPTRRRTYQLKIRERLLKDPWPYKGKLRRAIAKEIAKGNISNERL